MINRLSGKNACFPTDMCGSVGSMQFSSDFIEFILDALFKSLTFVFCVGYAFAYCLAHSFAFCVCHAFAFCVCECGGGGGGQM